MLTGVLPSLGLQFREDDTRVVNQTGGDLAAGSVVMFDLAQTSASTFDVGESDSVFAVVVTPSAILDAYGLFGVLLEDIDDGMRGKCRIRGVVNALMDDSAAVGSPCQVKAAANDLEVGNAAGSSTGKVVAVALTATTAGSASSCLFNGIEGFGLRDSL